MFRKFLTFSLELICVMTVLFGALFFQYSFTEVKAASLTDTFLPSKAEIESETKLNNFNQTPHEGAAKEKGVSSLTSGLYYVVDLLRYFLYTIAVIWMIYAAVKMITSAGNEEVINKSKTSLIWVIMGLIIVTLADVAVKSVFFGESGEVLKDESSAIKAAQKGVAELIGTGQGGLIGYLNTILIAVAVLMAVTAGIRMVTSLGNEETQKKQRGSLMWIGLGLTLIAINQVFINAFYKPAEAGFAPVETTTIISKILELANYLLFFIGSLATLALVGAGIFMIANFGNDEAVAKAKKIIFEALVGIVIAFSSYTIVSYLISAGG